MLSTLPSKEVQKPVHSTSLFLSERSGKDIKPALFNPTKTPGLTWNAV